MRLKNIIRDLLFLEETVTEDLREIQSVLINSNETYHASLKQR